MTLSNVRLKCGCFKATVAKLQMFGQGRSFSGTKPFVYPCAGDQLDPMRDQIAKWYLFGSHSVHFKQY